MNMSSKPSFPSPDFPRTISVFVCKASVSPLRLRAPTLTAAHADRREQRESAEAKELDGAAWLEYFPRELAF